MHAKVFIGYKISIIFIILYNWNIYSIKNKLIKMYTKFNLLKGIIPQKIKFPFNVNIINGWYNFIVWLSFRVI